MEGEEYAIGKEKYYCMEGRTRKRNGRKRIRGLERWTLHFVTWNCNVMLDISTKVSSLYYMYLFVMSDDHSFHIIL